MILSVKVIQSVLNYGNKFHNVGRPVVAIISECNRGRGSGKREKEVNLRQLACRNREDPLFQCNYLF